MVDDNVQSVPSERSPAEELSPEKVNEFIQTHWDNPNCECCGKADWTLSEAAQGRTAGLLVPGGDGRFVDGVDVRRVVVVTCGYCGNIRLINPWAIIRWHDLMVAAG